jgi:hypothetical protein
MGKDSWPKLYLIWDRKQGRANLSQERNLGREELSVSYCCITVFPQTQWPKALSSYYYYYYYFKSVSSWQILMPELDLDDLKIFMPHYLVS